MLTAKLTTLKKPIDFNNIIDPEDIDTQLVIDWIRHGRNRFNLGKNDQELVHALQDPDSRKKMSEVYAPHIIGFEKKPDVTLKAKKNITQGMIDILNEFPLPTKYPARKNLPVPPPNDSIHSTGPLAESALMLYNQILTPFIKTLVIIKYYSISTFQDNADEIIHDVIGIIQGCAEQGLSAREASLKAVVDIKLYYVKNGIDSKGMAQKFAEDQTSGNMVNFPYAVAAVKEILNDVAAYRHLRDTLKHMYVLMVNEFKVYQKYDEKQQIFKQAQVDKRNVNKDVNSIIITGAIIPSGIAKSNTIRPISRPLISNDAIKRVAELNDQIYQQKSVKEPDVKVIQSGARYRLICDKTKYTLAASDRYAPQLFLKMKYIMDLDIEFAVDFKTTKVEIYRINSPSKNTGQYINSYPYDPGLIKKYQQKIKFVINNGLNIDRSHSATIIDDEYSQSNSPVDFIHGCYAWLFGEVVRSKDYNILVKNKLYPLPNRTKIKDICDGEDDVQFIPARTLYGPPQSEIPDIDFPDYGHYNYAYECSYDIGEITSTSVIESRNWFKQGRNNQKVVKWRKFMALNNEIKSIAGRVIDY